MANLIGKRNLFYMAVTPDEYELPICVRKTSREIAEVFGVTSNCVKSSISHGKSGKTSERKFVRVELEDEDIEDINIWQQAEDLLKVILIDTK